MAFLQQTSKAIAAGVIALLGLLNSLFGVDLGVSEETINTALFALLTLVAVFFPNANKEKAPAEEPEDSITK